jgi:DNA-binding transcriptional MerR regulator
MRIGELSRVTDVPVATIKYYQREGLMPAGEHTSPNQVSYGEAHVSRIRLIRALVQVADLSIATIKQIVAIVDRPGVDLHDLLGKVQSTLPLGVEVGDAPAEDDMAAVTGAIAARGWVVTPGHPALGAAASVIGTWREFSQVDPATILSDYCAAAETVAAADMDFLARHELADDRMQVAVVGTALGDRLLSALRRVAHEDASLRRFGNAQPPPKGARRRRSSTPAKSGGDA